MTDSNEGQIEQKQKPTNDDLPVVVDAVADQENQKKGGVSLRVLLALSTCKDIVDVSLEVRNVSQRRAS